MKTCVRKLTIASAAITLFSTSAAFAQEASFQSQEETEVVPGQYIIKTVPGFNVNTLETESLGDEVGVIDTLPLVGAQIVEIADDSEIGSLTTKSLDIPGIAYIEPVYVVRVNETPNDPQYPPQWGFPKIKAPMAWDVRTDSDEMVIAVIDTGVDYRHPDIAANMWKNTGEVAGNGIDDDGNGIVDDVFGANFVPTAATGDPMDDNQHGTHVAGTIGAVTDNGLGVAGVNWTTKIMGLKFLSANGSGSTAGAIRAIEYAIKMKADVMNNSWGGGGFSRALEDVIRAADDAGILFVAAAGNDGKDNDASPHYPSSYDVPNVLAVMATDQTDAKPRFSNFGATSVDMGAPGVDILSTIPGGDYASFNGTSMATPHVAGAAALVWAQNPSLSHIDLKKRLMDTAEVIPALASMSVTGARLDLGKAIGESESPVACDTNAHTQIAYNEFFWSNNKTIAQNANVLSVSFTLPEKMVVDIAAHGSARRTIGAGNTLVRTGVFNDTSPNSMWTGSYRRVNFAAAADNRNVSSDFSIVLPKGDHTIYWKAWVADATLQFDSGTLTVRGIPCNMGGKLNLAAAEDADTTQSDPSSRSRTESLGTDDRGNSTTSSK